MAAIWNCVDAPKAEIGTTFVQLGRFIGLRSHVLLIPFACCVDRMRLPDQVVLESSCVAVSANVTKHQLKG